MLAVPSSTPGYGGSAAQHLPRQVEHPWPCVTTLLCPIIAVRPGTLARGCGAHVCLSLCSLDGGLPKHGAFQGADLKKSKTQAALKVPALRHSHWVLAGTLVLPAKLSHQEGGCHQAQPPLPYKDPSLKLPLDPSALSMLHTELKPSRATKPPQAGDAPVPSPFLSHMKPRLLLL